MFCRVRSQSVSTKKEKDVNLDQAITAERLKLKADSYQMSIGELANLYADRELTIDPDFQREFRWTTLQKVTFIESILMQFPLPSIFVASRPSGTWDVIDGLQRLSTIFEFIGILKDKNGVVMPPMALLATERFAELEGVFFSSDFGEPAFSNDYQRDFRRQRMDVKIILRESDDEMLYELFARLNAGGSQLTSQDLRNALINRREQAFRIYLDELRRNEYFQKAIALSDSDRNQQYDYELLLVFLVLLNESEYNLGAITNLSETLTLLAKRHSQLYDWDRDNSAKIFNRVFRLLVNVLGPNAFEPRPLAVAQGIGLSRDAFVAITSMCIGAIEHHKTNDLENAVLSYWSLAEKPNTFLDNVKWGREYFAHHK